MTSTPWPTAAEAAGNSPTRVTPEQHNEWTFVPDQDWSVRASAAVIGPTHGGVVSLPDGGILCSTDGPQSLVVLDADGSARKTMAPGFSGIHSMTPLEVEGVSCLLCTHLLGHQVLLLDLDGQCRWRLGCPMQSGLYSAENEFQPTAATQVHDGPIFVADGYGASVVHMFDEQRTYMKSFGGPEAGEGQLRSCHGMALDTRGSDPLLLICDRRNRRLVHYDLEGNYVATLAANLRRPCGVALLGQHLALAELEGRVGILNETHQSVAALGENPDTEQWANYDVPPEQWRPDVFNAPHAVVFDDHGHLYVSEWSRAGRVSKLKRIAANADE